MKSIEGNIVDIEKRKIIKGRMYYSNTIEKIIIDNDIKSNVYILPGLIDAHVHIESSMCTPINYAKEALKHGVIAAVTDPHEIANVCGIQGVEYMSKNALKTPMKIYTGAPSCVPATPFETSGAQLNPEEIDYLFKNNICTHLSEMMNFPGVLTGDKDVKAKIDIAKKYSKVIDGHAPLLSGDDLQLYYGSGITTDHECTTIEEATEKIELGFKIMLRKSSASNDFDKLYPLINEFPDSLMLCTDDCHPEDLIKGYINDLAKHLLNNNYSIFDILKVATKNAKEHYSLNVGLLQVTDPADFIVVDNLTDFNILNTILDGNTVYDINTEIIIKQENSVPINNFYVNILVANDILVRKESSKLKVIDIVENSLLTQSFVNVVKNEKNFIESDIDNDILKLVVLNRYQQAKPAIGFIRGFNIKSGAIATTVSHDSHNIVAVGTNDEDLLNAISKVQKLNGGMVYTDGNDVFELPLPIAGLMSDKSCKDVAINYEEITAKVKQSGCKLHAPFMTLSFMSLLVIPKLKLGDKGLFDVTKFEFTDLQI
ncbi:MAG: adenine deaminase [Prolixibacteraceae bacterium]|nr:adenine deaminase [Prolixibacteraceae bacterium]